MTNTQVSTPETEAAFIALLQYYYEIEAMYAAWDHFKQHWSKYEADVKLGTTHGGKIYVNTLPEAEGWIGPTGGTIRGDGDSSSYFLYQYTTFKRIGVVTGINPKYIPEYQTTAETWKTGIGNWWHDQHKEMWQLDEREGRGLLNKDDTRPLRQVGLAGNMSTVTITLPELGGDGGDSTVRSDVDDLYFFSPSMLNYIARKAVTDAKKHLYKDLYKSLMELINEIDNLSFTGPAGPRNNKYKRRLGSSHTAPNAYATAAAFVGGSGTTLAQLDDPNTATGNFKLFATKGVYQGGMRTPVPPFWRPNVPDNQVPGIMNRGGQGISAKVNLVIIAGVGEGADGDDNNAEGFKEWVKNNISGNQGKGGAKLLAVDTAIKALTAHLAAKVFLGTPQASTGFAGDAYKLDRRGKRLDMIKGFFGDSTAPSGGEQGEQAVSDKVESKTIQVKAKKQNLVPMDFQCFLLEQIRFLSNGHNSNYKHIMKLGTDRQPGLVKNKLNKTLSTDQVQALLELCPSTQALFTPYLKISRVDYDEYGKPTGVEKPLKIPNFLSGEALFDLASGLAPRVPGAGIKSFSWSLDGVQPAEVDNNISATLELYFQSVSDFFASSMQAGEDEASYLDLVISSPGTAKKKEKEEDPTKKGDAVKCGRRVADMLARKYEGSNYRIKVVAGWADPGVEALGRALGEDADRYTAYNISEAIENSKMSLFLQQTRHEFKFNQDGSLNLSIEYQASLTGMLVGPTADILGPSGAKIA